MNAPAARRFPTALLGSYGLGLGIGFGSIPLAAWVCDSTRDEMGAAYTLLCVAGALTGGLVWTSLSIVSLIRRERARALAITNLVVVGVVLAAAVGAWLLG
jgi:hypothetical protein